MRSCLKKPQAMMVLPMVNVLILLLFLAMPVIAPAQFTFTTNADGTLNISQYTGAGGAVVIPATTNGLAITTIGDDSFFDNSTLTSVTVGTNVTTIGDQAFSYSSLTNVIIPASTTNIAFDTFDDCVNLEAITVATNNPAYSSSAGVFFNQNQTVLIEFPEAKAGSYDVPDSVTNIGIYAFFGCTEVTNVSLSTNVTDIEMYAFYNCTGLAAFNVNTNNPAYSSAAGVLFNKGQGTLIAYPPANAATSYVMPNSVTNIGYEAFFGSPNLVNITIGTNVANIQDAAFEYCPGLASVSLPNSVTVIGGDAFAECSSVTNIAIGTGVTDILSQAFLDDPGVEAVSVATNNPAFTSVDGVLFNKNQTALYLYPASSSAASYAVPNSVTDIVDDAFFEAYHLAGITLDPNLQSIGGDVFQLCYNLTSITIPNSVTNLGFSAFYECFGLTNIFVGSGLTSIGFQTFAYCDNLEGIYFASNAPAMSSDVFDGDPEATAFYLPGALGWTATFDGIPTALWVPQLVNSAVRTNQFSFYVNWAAEQTVVVDGCTNLSHPVWSALQTNLLTSSSWYFSDPQWKSHAIRFYRARSQ